MSSPRYRSLLRTIYTAVLSSRLSPSEMQMLVMELRNGRLPDELAFMIDQALHHFLGHAEEGDPGDDRIEDMLELIKRNRISRSALQNILESLGYSPSSNNASTRTLLQNFMVEASASRTLKLIDILRSSAPTDNFLMGISKNRE